MKSSPVNVLTGGVRAKAIPLLFAVPFAALLIQFVLMRAGIGEPYPALVMPGFAGTRIDAKGVIHLQAAEVQVQFGDGGTAAPALAAIFSPMPASMVDRVAGRVFRRNARPAAAGRARHGARAWLLDHVVPARSPAFRHRSDDPSSPETTRWLRERLALLYPNRPATAIDFRWYTDDYRLGPDGSERTGHNLTSTAHVDLPR